MVLDPFLPVLIQGGMGAGVSGWQLARAVSCTGQLGVVSGIALDSLLARRLQRGDPGGHLRRALTHFPVPEIAERVLRRYFVDGGLPTGRPFRLVPMLGLRPQLAGTQLAVVGNFAEVFLAKEGHDGVVGVNYLEKTQLATPAAVLGAMLAGVDYVLVGAGIPAEIPGLLDGLAAGRPIELGVTVEGALPGERYTIKLDPAEALGRPAPPLRRPRFLAIVSAAVLAEYLMREPDRRPDGFVLEGPVAGGHSAPPRGRLHLDANGEPVYGPRDKIDAGRVAALGLPFWLAGGAASPGAIRAALAVGATGVQVGSIFALCRESALDEQYKRQLREQALAGTLRVRNDPGASPTGFPFKVAELPGTVAVPSVYEARERLCDIGYLRQVYRTANGRIGYRCPAEPVHLFVRKGGDPAETVHRACLCNGLVAALGLGQQRANGYQEPAIVTLGQDLGFLSHVLPEGADDYTARQAVDYLLNVVPRPVAFVTGGSRGIGAATALALAAAGYDVAIGYRNKAARAAEVAAALRQRGAAALTLGADITRPEEIAGLFGLMSTLLTGAQLVVVNAPLEILQARLAGSPERVAAADLVTLAAQYERAGLQGALRLDSGQLALDAEAERVLLALGLQTRQ
jgi:NAD(P)H-dependent flavin oxidoreductase YrpB (nitropropane dioxygenase family)